MKKLLLFLCSFIIAVSTLAACTDKQDSTTDNSSSSSSPAEEETVSYTITLNADGGTLTSTSVEVDAGGVYVLPTPIRVGYTFGGWKDAAGTAYALTGTFTAEENVTLKATWTANTYKITYNLAGGTLAAGTATEQTATYDQNTPALPTPERSGYTFTGWTHEGKSLPTVWNLTSNVTVLANWAEVQVEKCTITFKQNGKAPIIKEVEKGGTLTDIPTPTKEGYTSVWNRTDFTNITENILVEAEDTPIVYTITFNAEGGTGIDSTKNITFNTAYTLPTPNKAGHTFIGWKNGDANVAEEGDSWNIASNATLTAVWKVHTYTLKFVVTDGNLPVGKVATVTVTYGQTCDFSSWEPTPNDSSEHSFDKWVYTGTSTEFEVRFTCDWADKADGAAVTVEAIWSSNWTPFY